MDLLSCCRRPRRTQRVNNNARARNNATRRARQTMPLNTPPFFHQNATMLGPRAKNLRFSKTVTRRNVHNANTYNRTSEPVNKNAARRVGMLARAIAYNRGRPVSTENLAHNDTNHLTPADAEYYTKILEESCARNNACRKRVLERARREREANRRRMLGYNYM